jgi:hypothetical protein
MEEVLEKLKACYKSSPDKFCFIRCLEKEDQEAFMRLYAEILHKSSDIDLMNKTILCGAIQLNNWRRIMEKTKLKNKYILYRFAYVGELYNCEHKNKKRVEVLSNVKLAEFNPNGIKTKYLLINNNSIEELSHKAYFDNNDREDKEYSNTVWQQIVMHYNTPFMDWLFGHY